MEYSLGLGVNLTTHILTKMDEHIKSGKDKKTFFTNNRDFDTEYIEVKNWYKRLTAKEWEGE